MVGCKNCSSLSTCIECYETFKFNGSKCSCINTQYPDGNKCVNCVGPCLTCESAEKCITCEDGYTIDGYLCNKDGLSTVVIVLIVVAGLALIGAGMFPLI